MNRTILTLTATAAALLAAASPAMATDIGKTTINADIASFHANDISVGDANKMTISMPSKGFVDFGDSVKLTTSAPKCLVLQAGAHVQCDGTGIANLGVNASLGNGNDTVLLMPAAPGFTYWAVSLQGEAGADTLESRGPAASFYGGTGSDHVVPGPGKDEIDGGDDADVVDYGSRKAAVTVNLGTDQRINGAAGEQDKITHVENVVAGAGPDKLTGSDGANQILGGKGVDTISAKGGNDTIEARDGVKDTIACGTGSDTVSADFADVVSADCETVKRGGSPVGPGGFGLPPVNPPPPPIDPGDPVDPGNPVDPGDPVDPGNPVGDTIAPTLSKVAFAPRRFRAAKGSALRFILSEPATLAVKVERLSRGRRSGTRCRKETAKLRRRHAKPCTRGTKLTTLTKTGLAAGAGKTRFRAKIKKKTLKPGTYRATLIATDAAGNRSKHIATRFYVAKPRRK